MSRLPGVSGRRCVRALERAGFTLHQRHGSHIVMRHTRTARRVVVPDHRELKRGTLQSIIRESGLTRDEFLELL